MKSDQCGIGSNYDKRRSRRKFQKNRIINKEESPVFVLCIPLNFPKNEDLSYFYYWLFVDFIYNFHQGIIFSKGNIDRLLTYGPLDY